MSDPADAAAPAPRATRTAQRTAARRATQRAAATRLLPAIADRTRTALAEVGIDIEVFLVVPNSGDAILSFGTTDEPDPDDATWNTISQTVCRVVCEALGMTKVRTRALVSTTTRTAAPA